MVQAQALRNAARQDSERQALSPEDFQREQRTAVALATINDAATPRFERAFELLNKTNQFNTTGQRWRRPECAALFARGGKFIVFDVEDRFTAYGLVGVVLVKDNAIVQWAMSCRVIGMRVEQAAMAAIVQSLREPGARDIFGALIETDANHACRHLFAESGFLRDGETWTLGAGVEPNRPAYVSVKWAK